MKVRSVRKIQILNYHFYFEGTRRKIVFCAARGTLTRQSRNWQQPWETSSKNWDNSRWRKQNEGSMVQCQLDTEKQMIGIDDLSTRLNKGNFRTKSPWLANPFTSMKTSVWGRWCTKLWRLNTFQNTTHAFPSISSLSIRTRENIFMEPREPSYWEYTGKRRKKPQEKS